jgi:Mg-chelatase subunit ChlD
MLRWSLAPILAGALISISGSLAGLAQAPAQLRIDAVDYSAYPLLRAAVTVVDSAGRPVTGLPAEAFSAESGGQAVPVTGVTTAIDANVPAAVVLVFDTSGSMEGVPIEQARQAGKALVNELGPNDQVSIISFADSVGVVTGFTNDRAALNAAIDSLAAGGNTALYDGVVAGVNTAAGAGPQRRAVVLLSDGQDSGGVSQNSRESSLAAATSGGIPFFVVGLGDSIDQPYLQELADVSRGQLFLTPAPSALATLYGMIGAVLRHQYILELDVAALDPAVPNTLRIQVNSGGTTAAGEIALDLSPFAPPTAPTEAPTPTEAVATPSPVLIPEPEDGGTSVLAPAMGVLAVLLLVGAGGGLLLFRRQRRLALATQAELRLPVGRDRDQPVFAGTGPMGAVKADAWLETELADLGRFPLGEDPVTVGFTGDCTICLPLRQAGLPAGQAGLPADSGQASARVRVWKREGRYMLHNLSRLGKVLVGGKPVTWAVLEDGDEIEIGSSRLVFRSLGGPAVS